MRSSASLAFAPFEKDISTKPKARGEGGVEKADDEDDDDDEGTEVDSEGEGRWTRFTVHAIPGLVTIRQLNVCDL